VGTNVVSNNNSVVAVLKLSVVVSLVDFGCSEDITTYSVDRKGALLSVVSLSCKSMVLVSKNSCVVDITEFVGEDDSLSDFSVLAAKSIWENV
jgi:hypothetical protein